MITAGLEWRARLGESGGEIWNGEIWGANEVIGVGAF